MHTERFLFEFYKQKNANFAVLILNGNYMAKTDKINVQGTEIILLSHQKEDYISLTDMAKYKNAEIPATVISHWMSTNFSINYMGLCVFR